MCHFPYHFRTALHGIPVLNIYNMTLTTKDRQGQMKLLERKQQICAGAT
ncbi:MAG: hypothetical protein P857_74 [Candidatus Xenolissoclinum pacificiensis L6]|uniref:Uncharacterized protein n=1 Tax=Candidatus Xenolissoclinum pacificiensis L6 TaxID=1401685 RepID=W2V222_9RICK|nr:MAG: hypothetical protein P857_74 [Candidatus Xenolissoclinum pacificiensis L6]